MLEAATIRFLWVLHAFRLKRTPGLCPPQCDECHTFKWPCRARIRNSAYSRYMARPKMHQRPQERELFFPFANMRIGDILEIKEDESGLLITGQMTDDQAKEFAQFMSERY